MYRTCVHVENRRKRWTQKRKELLHMRDKQGCDFSQTARYSFYYSSLVRLPTYIIFVDLILPNICVAVVVQLFHYLFNGVRKDDSAAVWSLELPTL